MEGEKILITGGAGFVGSHLAKRCLKEGFGVHILARPATDLWRIKDVLPKIGVVYGDLTERNAINKILAEIKPAGIFHLAASNIMSGKTASEKAVVETNILGAVNLVDAAVFCGGLEFFVNTGSFLEYGPGGGTEESASCWPGELYSISKLAGTLYARASAAEKSLPAITLRLFTPYGAAVQAGRLVADVITNALQGRDILLTDKNVSRDFIYIEDLAELYLKAASSAGKYKGGIFNAGSGASTNLEQFSKEILEQTKSASKILWNSKPAVSYDKTAWKANLKKTLSSFDWRPEHSLKDGLKKTIAWYKDNLDLFKSKSAAS